MAKKLETFNYPAVNSKWQDCATGEIVVVTEITNKGSNDPRRPQAVTYERADGYKNSVHFSLFVRIYEEIR